MRKLLLAVVLVLMASVAQAVALDSTEGKVLC